MIAVIFVFCFEFIVISRKVGLLGTHITIPELEPTLLLCKVLSSIFCHIFQRKLHQEGERVVGDEGLANYLSGTSRVC